MPSLAELMFQNASEAIREQPRANIVGAMNAGVQLANARAANQRRAEENKKALNEIQMKQMGNFNKYLISVDKMGDEKLKNIMLKDGLLPVIQANNLQDRLSPSYIEALRTSPDARLYHANLGSQVQRGLKTVEEANAEMTLDKMAESSDQIALLKLERFAIGQRDKEKRARITAQKNDTMRKESFVKSLDSFIKETNKETFKLQGAKSTLATAQEQLKRAIKENNITLFRTAVKSVIKANGESRISDADFNIIARRPGVQGLFDRVNELTGKIPAQIAQNLIDGLDIVQTQNSNQLEQLKQNAQKRAENLATLPGADRTSQDIMQGINFELAKNPPKFNEEQMQKIYGIINNGLKKYKGDQIKQVLMKTYNIPEEMAQQFIKKAQIKANKKMMDEGK